MKKKKLTKPFTFCKWKHILKKNYILKMKAPSQIHFENENMFLNQGYTKVTVVSMVSCSTSGFFLTYSCRWAWLRNCFPAGGHRVKSHRPFDLPDGLLTHFSTQLYGSWRGLAETTSGLVPVLAAVCVGSLERDGSDTWLWVAGGVGDTARQKLKTRRIILAK